MHKDQDKPGTTPEILDAGTIMTMHRSLPVDPLSPTTGKKTISDTPKLKASCNNCAASKVKCTKERPVCSRCAKRGENCIYLASKRAGRVARTKPRSSHNNQPPDPSQNESDGGKEPSLCPSSPSIRDNGPFPASPIHTASPQDKMIALDMLSMPESFSTVPTSTDVLGDCDMDDFLASLNEEPKLDGLLTPLNEEPGFGQFLLSITGKPEETYDMFDPTFLYGQTYDSLADPLTAPTDTSTFFSLPSESISSVFGATTPHSEAVQTSATPTNPDSYDRNEKTLPIEQNCRCLTTSANLLTRLFTCAGSSARAPVMQTAAEMTSINGSPSSEAETIISKNEECMELIHTMLRCQCTHNSYILNLLAMVVLKVLAWYAAAARCDPVVPADDQMTGSHNSRTGQQGPAPTTGNAGDYAKSGTPDSRRMTAQLVLSQLHRVQGLINQIARRFAQMRQPNGQQHSDSVSKEPANSSDEDTEKISGSHDGLDSPFSHDTLEQLESDLRQRLRNVWLEMKRIVLEE